VSTDVIKIVYRVLTAERVVNSIEKLGEQIENFVGEELTLGYEIRAFLVGIANSTGAVLEERYGKAEVEVK